MCYTDREAYYHDNEGEPVAKRQKLSERTLCLLSGHVGANFKRIEGRTDGPETAHLLGRKAIHQLVKRHNEIGECNDNSAASSSSAAEGWRKDK